MWDYKQSLGLAESTIHVKQEVEAVEEAGVTIHRMNLRMQFMRSANGR